jgi:hypothetical protein
MNAGIIFACGTFTLLKVITALGYGNFHIGGIFSKAICRHKTANSAAYNYCIKKLS